MSFNIGDRVRFLQQKGEGIVRSFPRSGQVEVELTDGFAIVVLEKQLVSIAREEKLAFKPESKKEEIAQRANTVQVLNRKGLFLAFLPVQANMYHYYIINNSDFDFVGSLGIEALSKYQGIWHGVLHGRGYTRKPEMLIESVKLAPTFVLRGFLFRPDEPKAMPFQEMKLKLVTGEFRARLVKEVPILKQAAHLFVMDEEQEPLPENFMEALKEAISSNRTSLSETKSALIVPNIIDLHIEKLAPEFASLMPQAILEKQILAFIIAMENALAIGMDGITFIHGIGNGKLKEEIAKRCAVHPHVAFYKEADKGNFGFGATLVKFQ